MLVRVCALFLLFAAPPAYAQTVTPEQTQQLADAAVGERLDRAIEYCLAETADASSIEAQAVAAGWPNFETNGRWRLSNVRVGDGVLASFGFSVSQVPDLSAPVTGVECKFIVPTAVADVLRRRIAGQFPADDGEGFFYLESGSLRSLTLMEMLDGEVPELIGGVTEARRLAIVTTELNGPATIADVAVFRPTRSAAE